MKDRMPRLSILRPHRRAHHQNADVSPPPPAPTAVTAGSPAPPTPIPPPQPSSKSDLASSETGQSVSSLPPLDIGSPGLGSIGQWLHEPTSATSATPAPSSAAFSRTSTPWTNITAPTPAPAPPPIDRAKTSEIPSVRESASPPPPPAQQDRKSRQPALRLASAPPGISPAQHHEQPHHSPPLPQKKDTKLGRLNPMSLLRRRSSQNQLQKAKEKDKDHLPNVDFNPGIIYGTRHPDWSSHPVKNDGRALSPVLIGKVSTELQRKSFDGRSGSASPVFRREHARMSSGGLPTPIRAPPSPPMSPPPALPVPELPLPQPEPLKIDDGRPSEVVDPYEVVVDRIPPTLAERASSPLSFQEAPIDNEGELHPPPSEDIDQRRGVTLFDHPLALPHHSVQNSSRFSFDESKAPSAAPSFRKQRNADIADDYDDEDNEDFQFDMGDDEEDDGFERANEGLFDLENAQMPVGSGSTEEQYSALQAAVSALAMRSVPQDPASIGVAVTGIPGHAPQTMPIPGAADEATPSTSGTTLSDNLDVNIANKPIEMAGRKRLEHISNPRNLDLNDDDLDFIQEDSGLAGYEDEDEDDMYFDDGIISRVLPVSVEERQQQQQQQQVVGDEYLTAPVRSLPLADGTMSNGLHPLLTPSTNPAMSTAVADDPRRFSMATNTSFQPASSGLAGEDGSLAPPLYEPHAFPPFLNPVGGGFFSPHNISHQVMNNLTLDSLTSQLHQLQVQQQQQHQFPRNSVAFSDIIEPPEMRNPEFGNQSAELNPYPDFGLHSNAFAADEYEADDDAIIAAANADALRADSEGFYGSEFGFYASNLEPNELGGFFGAVNAPPPEMLRPPIRRPSLTPISERSESSYRNSMVFSPGAAQWGGGSILGLAQLAAEEEAGGAAGGAGQRWSTGSEGLGGAQGVKQLELELMRIRRSAWGGSQGSLRSGGSSPGGWPAGGEENVATPGWGTPPGLPMTPGGAGGMQLGMGMGMGGIHGMSMGMGGISPISPVGSGSMGPPPPPSAGGGGPPGLRHPGSRAMLPTKESFEDMEGTAMRQPTAVVT